LVESCDAKSQGHVFFWYDWQSATFGKHDVEETNKEHGNASNITKEKLYISAIQVIKRRNEVSKHIHEQKTLLLDDW